jgi:argininosuccinate lyase
MPHLGHVRAIYFSLCGVVLLAGAASAQQRDEFYWLGEINKASSVMVTEQGIVPKDLGRHIADAVTRVIADGDKPGAARSGNYLTVEQSLVAVGGPDVTRIHSGRSRQDIGATFRRLFLRDDLLGAFEKLIETRDVLLDVAEAHRDAIVPAYTWGVQAQPISFGHYLGAYVEALSRSADRFREAWTRVNQSPLGSAALGTSSFPVDRVRLAELLGFDGNVENSLDANQISPVDTGVEVVSIASSSALTIGMLAADITAQYSYAKPWLVLAEGSLTGTSSIMPQKRNPTGLVSVREQASTLVGESMTYYLQSHNVMHGMGDYKGDTPNQVLKRSARLYGSAATLMKSLVFDEKRALDEVNGDYATTTELADTLQRVADVPFRVGHHFASELVDYGRSHNLRPADIPYADARKIYTEAATLFKMANAQLPLTEQQFRTSLTPENMVRAAKVLGGPQPAEVARMLADQRARVASDREWLQSRRQKLENAARQREAAFASLK